MAATTLERRAGATRAPDAAVVTARGRRAGVGLSLLGAGALVGLVGAMALVALAAAAEPTSLVATAKTLPHVFPGWLAGPLHPIGLHTSAALREGAVLVLCACYAAALRCCSALSGRQLWSAIVLAHVAALLAPPLLSGDVFGYLGFARLAVLHGLNPYLYTAASAPHDAIRPLLGWTNVTTPYGPLFTLFTEALVPLGIAAGVWILKAVAALTSLATVWLIWRAAPRLGRSRRAAIAFYGLNPLVLLFAVAGAHNETLFGMFVAGGALLVVSGRDARGGIPLVLGAAVKASAALVVPFAALGARRRGRISASMGVALILVALVGLIAFGPHLFNMAGAWITQQHQVAGHSLPSETSKLLGAGQLALGVRIGFLVFAALVFAGMLWRTWRGASWLDCYGWSTLALLAATAWVLPWYGLWALLPASLSSSRRLRVAALLATAYLVAIRIAVKQPLAAA